MTKYNELRRKRLQESLDLNVEDSSLLYKVDKHENTLLNTLFYVVIITATVLFYTLFAVARVDGRSMDPTLHGGQFILLSKTEKVDRFDIAVFVEREVDNGPTKKIVKRVIGLPGDTVTVINGELFINDKTYEETYLSKKNIKNWKNESFTIKVPQGHYFVLGDNRDISKDSRQVGNFKKDAVIGVKMFE